MNHQSSINLSHSFWFNHQWSIRIWSMLSLGSRILSLSCSLQSITLFSFIDGAVVNSFFVYMKVIYHEIFSKMLNWWSLVNIAMMFVCQNQFEVVTKKTFKTFYIRFFIKRILDQHSGSANLEGKWIFWITLWRSLTRNLERLGEFDDLWFIKLLVSTMKMINSTHYFKTLNHQLSRWFMIHKSCRSESIHVC